MVYRHTIDATSYVFEDLRDLLAKATPPRSGDRLAGVAADSAEQMIAARIALADVPLKQFLQETVIPYEDDEVTRLIVDTHDAPAFAPVSSLTVGAFRDWLLSDAATPGSLQKLSRAVTPEMAAAVSKVMRNQDLIAVARKCEVTTRFRNTIGLRNRMSVRLQPNHPFDDLKGITASILDGLLLGSGDACIGINPASDDPKIIGELLQLVDDVIARLQIPTQACVLTHVTTTLGLIDRGSPVDLVFQSVAGTQDANRSFGIDLALLKQAHQAGLSLRRGTVGTNCMYFETGQGSALSAGAHHGVDQQTCEARAYAVARAFDPLLVNSVVGFIGPEYLFDGKEIIRAGLEDHFCGKLLRRRLLHQPCRGRPGRHGQSLDAIGRRRRDLYYGGARRRRRDAELSIHLVSRRALRPRSLWPETGAGVRRLALSRRACRCRFSPCRRHGSAARFCNATDCRKRISKLNLSGQEAVQGSTSPQC